MKRLSSKALLISMFLVLAAGNAASEGEKTLDRKSVV